MISEGAAVPALDEALLEAFRKISPSTVGHMTDAGFFKGLHLVSPGPAKLVGRAFTVQIPHLDSSAVHIAVSLLSPGDVLVVDMNGDHERASVGGMVAYAAVRRGAVGIVVDGSITDITEVLALRVPVYSRGVSPLTTRNLGIEGAVQQPIQIGGSVVEPGDLIFGDENGAMAIRGPNLRELARTAYLKERGEEETRHKLDAGALLMDLSGAARFRNQGGTSS